MDEYNVRTFLRGGKYNSEKYRMFVLHLRELLIQHNYIDEVKEGEWITMFEGLAIKEEDLFSFCWNLANSHCVYLFDVLAERNIIVKEKLDATINNFFNIKNVAQTRYSYFPKPKGYDKIEKIVSDITNHLSKF